MALRQVARLSKAISSSAQKMNISNTPGSPAAMKDWSAAQYLKFGAQRTRPARDLLAQVHLDSPQTIIDLGCGPGNSTQVLAARYPGAAISGIDSSLNMIEAAKKALPNVHFSVADINAYEPENKPDLLFSNAVLHWIKRDDRIAVMKRLIGSLRSGGVLAMQVPDNYTENLYLAVRDVSATGPWAEVHRRLDPSSFIGPPLTPQELYDGLKPLCSSIDLWRCVYHHVLDSHEEIVEWAKGAGLRPFADPLEEEQREGFLAAYLDKLREAYPLSADGKVLLPYPRLFMVAVRSEGVDL